jgi:hypothetical protein
MLRITPVAGPRSAETFKLEGKLVGPWVAALREACVGRVPLHLDLTGVRFIDAAGVALLRELSGNGATLTGCSGLIAELLQGAV